MPCRSLAIFCGDVPVLKSEIDAIVRGMTPVVRSFVAKQLRDREDAMVEALGKMLARTRTELRAEMHETTNPIRERVGLPVILVRGMEKPRVRLKSTRGRSW